MASMRGNTRKVSGASGYCRCLLRISLVLATIVVSGLPAARIAGGAEPAPLAYVPGHGLHVGSSGLSLGGYLNLEVRKPESDRAEFLLDKLAVFVTWDLSPRWRFFSEAELEDVLIIDDDGARAGDDIVQLERLHLDYLWSDAFTVRVGKFLTPMGIWNPVHAPPLVWTVSRPFASGDDFFDEFVTGVMLSGSEPAAGFRLDYSLYGQPTDQLLAEDDVPRSARRGAGARIQLSTSGDWAVGLSSLAQDNQVLRRWESINGADFKWEGHGSELWSEIVANTPIQGGLHTEWASYIQATTPLVADFYAVARYEHVHDVKDVNLGVVGLAYRPKPYLVFKAEYVFSDKRSFSGPGSQDVERGFAAAVALFF